MELPATEIFAPTRRSADFSKRRLRRHQRTVGQRFNARGVSLTEMSLTIMISAVTWFIEPSAGIVWSRTRVDPVSVPGTGIAGPSWAWVCPSLGLDVNDIEMFLVVLGCGRHNLHVGNMIWQPFASAGVFMNFEARSRRV